MKRIVSWTILAATFIVAAGCAGGGTSDPTAAPDPTIRYMNGISDAAPVDFLMNDTVHATGVAYLGSSPTFVDTDPLIRDISVRESSTTVEFWTEEFQFDRDKDYLMVALGLKNFGSEPEKRVRLARFDIDRRAPNANKSRIYVIHGFNRALGFTTPQIDFQNPGNNPQVKLSEIDYLKEKHIDIDATTQTFEVRRAGTESVFMTTTFAFGAGKIYAVVALGVEGGVGAQAPHIQIVELQSE